MSVQVFNFIILVQLLCFSYCFAARNSYTENIKFFVYRDGGVDIPRNGICSPSFPNEKFAIIVHGWIESCQTEWIQELIPRLTEFRGGCIMCMDYNKYSKGDYFVLVSKFEKIVEVLTDKLYALEAQGFNPDNGYMFGFSYGAHLALEAGRRFGYQKIGQIDACEPAGPGFDSKPPRDSLAAAKNVQCIHTSLDKGTSRRNCHQNWIMGVCGSFQYAAGPFPKGSHGLCPYFYNSAFTNDFLATQPNGCASQRPALSWPSGFKMGYTESRKSEVFGDLFAQTSNAYPYTDNTLANYIYYK